MSDEWPADHVPQPARVDVELTVRDQGFGREVPVARLTLVDVLGQQRSFEVDEHVLADLLAHLATANAQLVRGR